MSQRLSITETAPEVYQALNAADQAVRGGPLGATVRELVKIRASQLNGCAYCVDLHTGDARKKGETERRLYAVSVWRETPFFTARERAALAWTEAVTLISTSRASDADYELMCAEFDDKERVDLTMAIATINAWNRLAIAFRKMPTV